jgi:hypothetical protein
MSLSLRDIRRITGDKIPKDLLKPMFYGLLLGPDYLHSEARVVHTGMNSMFQNHISGANLFE